MGDLPSLQPHSQDVSSHELDKGSGVRLPECNSQSVARVLFSMLLPPKMLHLIAEHISFDLSLGSECAFLGDNGSAVENSKTNIPNWK